MCGQLDYLIFKCLAERTIALAQQAKLKYPQQGYDPLLAAAIRAIARETGLPQLKVAAITGDDVLALLTGADYVDDTGAPVAQLEDRLLSAYAYLGAQTLVAALAQGADVVATVRVADPALVLAPLIHAFGWAMDDWHRLGPGTLVGHLLECTSQVCGGYFPDPGYKDAANLARLGFPIGEWSKTAASSLPRWVARAAASRQPLAPSSCCMKSTIRPPA